MNHLLALLILSAGPSFSSPDLAQRTLAAEAWSRRHGVAFSARALKPLRGRADPCVRLRAPAPTGCAEVLELCSFGMSAGACSGSWMEQEGLAQPDGGVSLELIGRGGWEVDAYECETQFPGFWSLADGGRQPVSRRGRQLEVEQCLREARADVKAQATNVQCDVIPVNPCRGEAYLSCRGRVHGERMTRTTWVSWADGGEPVWQHPIGTLDDEPASNDEEAPRTAN
jgi:hypothetical protein